MIPVKPRCIEEQSHKIIVNIMHVFYNTISLDATNELSTLFHIRDYTNVQRKTIDFTLHYMYGIVYNHSDQV